MAHVRFEEAGVRLEDKHQDLRGRELRDAVGRTIGTIETMIVDTDTARVETAITGDGREYPVRDLQIMEEAVYYVPDVAPAAAPAEPEAAAPPPPAEVVVAEPVVAEPVVAEPVVAEPVEPGDEAPLEPVAVAPPVAAPPPAEVVVAEPVVPEPETPPADEPPASDMPNVEDHFQATYGDSGLDLEDLAPAYRFGYEAAAYDVRFQDRAFDEAEDDLRRAYYARYGYPAADRIVWNRIAPAVREGFRRAR